ncbi:MAG: hypothetical protein U9M95_03650, partial [Candidatus Altiarchaeota archaeon]|nr:hypothetical protein [Candidatus Altiarchaeota archaeon]
LDRLREMLAEKLYDRFPSRIYCIQYGSCVVDVEDVDVVVVESAVGEVVGLEVVDVFTSGSRQPVINMMETKNNNMTLFILTSPVGHIQPV